MQASRRHFLLGFASLALVPAAAASAAEPTYTTIRVGDMHCAACAKKIARKLYAVPGVLEVRADVNKDTAYVVPQQTKSPSPRAMWEAVEAAGFKVVRMDGPGGNFTAKPRARTTPQR